MILRYAYHKPLKAQLPNKHEWQNGFNSDNKGGLVWCMDRSKTNTNYDTRLYKWGLKEGAQFQSGAPHQGLRGQKYMPLRHAKWRIQKKKLKI